MKLPRLGVVLLGTIARDLGWEVKIYVEDIAEIDWREPLTADLVGISTITSTAPRAYAIAEALSEYGRPVVMGGPHVTFLADEALAHCPLVVRGEGEKAFPLLLDAVARGESYDAVPNLSWRDAEGTIRHNPLTGAVDDLDSLPFPDFGLIVGWTQVKSFGSVPIIPIQSSRGCPFGCRFCSVIGMFGRKMRFRSVDNMLAELERYKDLKPYIFFYDDNFTADRARARELVSKAKLERNLFSAWSAQVRSDAARDDELLALMQATNCSNVYIGFESVNPEALVEMNKRQTVDDMVRAVNRFREVGVDVHGMFVFGFDSDTPAALDSTIRFAVDSGILTTQFLILTPLPGTPLFDDLSREGRIAISDYSLYDGQHVVFTPKNMSPWRLQWAQIKGHARFYSRWRTMKYMASGYLTKSAVYLYARRMHKEWRGANDIYLKALKLAERARRVQISFDFRTDLGEIARQVRAAAAALSLSPASAPA